jgi:hypothetical protein
MSRRSRFSGGNDSQGRSNHERVCQVKKLLQESGLRCWLDEEQMQGDINKQMTKGIDGSATAVVFITGRYNTKVDGEGAAGADDNWASLGQRLHQLDACAVSPLDHLLLAGARRQVRV